MIDTVVGIIVIISAIVILVASIGIVRFNNLYSRMHVVTKVSSFALLLLLFAVNLMFLSIRVFIITIIVFHVIILLSPISAHVIAKVSKLISSKK